jgi:thymidylate synthase (FAD)
MNVELTWATPNAEELIVKMARVSAPSNQDNMDTAPRLLRYLIKHKHWSPFEMANMCVEIHTNRSISPQILRHRSFSFQEFSQRYADTRELGSASIPHLRRQDLKNRQNSTDDLAETLGPDKLASFTGAPVNSLKKLSTSTKRWLALVWQKNVLAWFCH